MKRETLFEALTDVGDDLLQMAQTRTFANPWKRWGKLAACIALVLCLTAVSLPYLPIGCGASMESAGSLEVPAAEECVPEEAPAEMEEAPAEEPAAEEEAPADEEPAPEMQEVVSIFFDGRRYELQPMLMEEPENPGEELGLVEDSDGRDLIGCPVYAVQDSEDLYVQTPEGLRYAKLADH